MLVGHFNGSSYFVNINFFLSSYSIVLDLLLLLSEISF